MAPSRRKGASKAAAAAAARRQWKVGDLVLAKVKGFPAWPATVSEPEKWGYSADWKKVLVYFFGTKQIAFCNPADVEEFTEEKKESLLGKRQGRSADFVRAVQEIVDCFDKLKESNQADLLRSGDVTAENDVGDLNVSKSTSNEVQHDSRLKSSSPCPKDDEKNSLSVGAHTEAESLDQRGTSEEPVDSSVAPCMPLPYTYTLRKKSRSSQPPRCASQKNISLQRSRSLLRSDSRGSQNGDFNCSDGKNSGEGGINGFWDGPLRRAKRSKRSPDGSVPSIGGSPICNSNGTVEDNGSEVAMAESETHSNNEGSADESNHKQERYEVNGSCEGLELSRRLDLQAQSAIVRKKRNPGRRRILNDTSETASRLDQEVKMDVDIQKESSVPTTSCGNVIDSHPKNEGDEHLPLVKRARVRMGKLLSEEKQQQIDSLVEIEEKPVEPYPTRTSTNPDASSNCNIISSKNSLTVNDSIACFHVSSETSDKIACSHEDNCTNTSDNKSSKNACVHVMNGPVACLGPHPTESLNFGCAFDGEAALPPSKRHRGLEAMSAYAAEENQSVLAATLSNKSDVAEHMSFVKVCSNVLMEDKVPNIKSPFKSLHCVDILNDDRIDVSLCSDLLSSDLKTISSLEMHMSDSGNRISDSVRLGPALENVEEVAVSRHDKDLTVSCYTAVSGNALQEQALQMLSSSADAVSGNTLQEQALQTVSSSSDGPETVLGSVTTGLTQLSVEDVTNTGAEEGANCAPESNEVSEVHIDTAKKSVSSEDDAVTVEHHDGACVDLSNKETKCSAFETVKTMADGKIQATSMCQPVEENQHAAMDVNMESSRSPSSNLSSLQQTYHGTSISVCPALDQVDAHITTNSSSAEVDVHKHVAQPYDVMSTANKNYDSQHSENCPTDAKFPQKKHDECRSLDAMNLQEKSGERINIAEVKAALASLELTLGSLTRTKESIGRATRIAVDCVKFGVATEVVELLAIYLEKESSLHKRVDLFFLVDSIAQCCRTLKGEVGGTYISAVKETLARMLSAAAPSGHTAKENRRQCLKVLRLWLERRILPDSAIRQHIRELESQNTLSSTGGYSRRMSRTERSFDDPLRDMEGMFVDEYGSNSSFQLPGFCMPRMLKEEDDGSDSDGGSFEAVTPEHDSGNKLSQEVTALPPIEKHRRILEDVDGELEMEDVAPCDVNVVTSTTNTGNPDLSTHRSVAPLPCDVPPRAPPLPTSPPPLPPLPPPPPPPPPPFVPHGPTMSHVNVDSQLHVGRNSGQEPMLSRPPAPTFHHPMQMPEATASCSYNSYPLMHTPGAPGNNIQQADSNMYGKPYNPRPPYPSPSNQFSYFQADQQVRPHREAPPPSYYDRPHFCQNLEGGHVYGDQDSIRAPRHEMTNGWGYSRPPFPNHGPVHPEPIYSGQTCEPTRPHDHGWSFPPHPVHHLNHVPNRPPCDGPVPVGVRAPGYWRPR